MVTKPELSSRKAGKAVTRTLPEDHVPRKKRGVVHISHLPHEFSEKEIRTFFGQFGRIATLRLSRSAKTGNSRGFGYIKYEIPEIAQIAAEAANNYFIGGKAIKAEVMHPESVLADLFKGAKKLTRNPRFITSAKVRSAHHSKVHTTGSAALLKKDESRDSKLSEAGVEYKFVRKTVVKKTKVVAA